MHKWVGAYYEDKKINFYTTVCVFFILVQIIYGYIVTLTEITQRYNFSMNFIFLSYVVYLCNLILNKAKVLGDKTYENARLIIKIYTIISIFITSFLSMQVTTLFSYIGILIGNIFIHNYVCDFLCMPFKQLLT